jgi:hypothetical protein
MSNVTLTITDPIYINTEAGLPNTDILLEVQQPFYIGLIDQTNIVIGVGERLTTVHAGVYLEESVYADYFYLCVVTGDAETTPDAKDGTAIWMKYQMSLST